VRPALNGPKGVPQRCCNSPREPVLVAPDRRFVETPDWTKRFADIAVTVTHALEQERKLQGP